MAEGTKATKSLHIPTRAYRALRRLQLQIEEQTGESLALGDLAGALIILGGQRPVSEIIEQVKRNSQPGEPVPAAQNEE